MVALMKIKDQLKFFFRMLSKNPWHNRKFMRIIKKNKIKKSVVIEKKMNEY